MKRLAIFLLVAAFTLSSAFAEGITITPKPFAGVVVDTSTATETETSNNAPEIVHGEMPYFLKTEGEKGGVMLFVADGRLYLVIEHESGFKTYVVPLVLKGGE